MALQSNRKLADDYWDFVNAYPNGGLGQISYLKQRRFIENLDTNLEEYFRENRTFDKLNIRGLGIDTRRRLELILLMGKDEAIKIAREGRARELESYAQFKFRQRKPRSKGLKDEDPGFENAEKINDGR